MHTLADIEKAIQLYASPQKATFVSGYFKTKEGEYGFGDIFLGLTVPQSRSIAKRFADLPFPDIKKLLQSTYHEYRLVALLLLIDKFSKSDKEKQKEIYDLYLTQTKYINNWDLVDLSADKIIGEYLRKNSKNNITILKKLATSEIIWERRISMIATYQFIKNGKSSEALEIAQILLHDKHDLIQKAVGWMLREIGKRCSEEIEESFLKTRYKTMPRTALRYAIERFNEEKRKKYLRGEV